MLDSCKLDENEFFGAEYKKNVENSVLVWMQKTFESKKGSSQWLAAEAKDRHKVNMLFETSKKKLKLAAAAGNVV